MPYQDRYVGLYCVESPEARFQDVVRVPILTPTTTVPIDPVFLAVCEQGSVEVISVASPSPAVVGASLSGRWLTVKVASDLPPFVTVLLSGIRLGRRGMRFPVMTRTQMLRNNSFWDQARC